MKRMAIAAALASVAAGAVLVSAPAGVLAAQDTRIRVAEPQVHVITTGGSAIGVTVREVTTDDVAKAKLDAARGVYIESVRDGSPASRAGFRSGDIVIEFDGERVRSVEQFTRLVRETATGRNVNAIVMRDGSRQTLTVAPERRASVDFNSDMRVLSDRAREQADLLRDRIREGRLNFNLDVVPELHVRVAPGQLGATLTTLSDQLETYFGVSNGALVSSVQADSPASQAGLRAGDVITHANGRRVDAPNDVVQAVRNAGPGSELALTVVREKKELTLKTKLPERRQGSGNRGVAL